MEKRDQPGILILLMKIGPKMASVALKMQSILGTVLNKLFSFKAAGVVASAGLYSYLLTWQMGIALVAFIGIHEYGHLWAMHRRGIKTRGMFFLPGIGAVAVADEKFGSAKNEAFIAIMGPVFGILGFVLFAILAYWYTKNPLAAAIASFMTFVNLLNLLPINPLDGGRIVKSLVYSENSAQSFILCVVISCTALVFGLMAGFSLLFIMAFIGFYEHFSEFGIKDKLPTVVRMGTRIVVVSVLFYVLRGVFGDLYPACVNGVCPEGHLSFWSVVALIMAAFMGSFLIPADIRGTAERHNNTSFDYPSNLLRETWQCLREMASVKGSDIAPIESYDWMKKGQKAFYAFSYLGLVALHIEILRILAHIPGAEMGRDFMK